MTKLMEEPCDCDVGECKGARVLYCIDQRNRATPAPSSPGVPDSVRALSEAASPDWDTNEATPYILGPPIDGEIDRFAVIARGPAGCRQPGDVARQWQADRMFAVACVNHVRTLLSAHPAGQSTGQGAETKPDAGRLLKEALFACLKEGTHDQNYGGVLAAGGKKAWLRFSVVDAETSAAIAARPSAPEAQGAWIKTPERFVIAVKEFLADWRKGDFSLPKLAELDAESIEAALEDWASRLPAPPASSGQESA